MIYLKVLLDIYLFIPILGMNVMCDEYINVNLYLLISEQVLGDMFLWTDFPPLKE